VEASAGESCWFVVLPAEGPLGKSAQLETSLLAARRQAARVSQPPRDEACFSYHRAR